MLKKNLDLKKTWVTIVSQQKKKSPSNSFEKISFWACYNVLILQEMKANALICS